MKKAMIVATVGGFLTQFEMCNVQLLQEQGFEVHYAANFENEIYQIQYDVLEKFHVTLHHVPFAKNPIHGKTHIQVIRALKNLIEELDIDLIHCHTPVGGVAARIAAAISNRNVYVIYTAHGFHFYKGAPLKNWIYYPVEKAMAKLTDCIITINSEDYVMSCKFVTKKGGLLKKIPGIGIDLQRFQIQKELREKVRKEHSVSREMFHIITIGEINRNKNLETAIKAIAELSDCNIVYSIYGRGKSVEYIKQLIREYGLEQRVFYRGYCHKTAETLQSADLFLFPSIREGLGMSAIEALACGVPVIAMNNRGTREYIIEGQNGWMCQNDPKEFAQKLKMAYEYFLKNGEVLAPEQCRKSIEAFRKENTEIIMRNVYGYASEKIR